MILFGADRVTANGDVANKIGVIATKPKIIFGIPCSMCIVLIQVHTNLLCAGRKTRSLSMRAFLAVSQPFTIAHSPHGLNKMCSFCPGTIDLSLNDGSEIVIEERGEDEVLQPERIHLLMTLLIYSHVGSVPWTWKQ